MKRMMLPWGEKESFFLTYPTTVSTDGNGESNDFNTVGEEKRPLVILFAWTSAIERHMRLYSKIYEDEGFITLICICPVMVAFWHHDEMSIIAQKLIKFMDENNLSRRPTIIQIFSNGGALQYEFFMKALKRTGKSLQIKGVIFDSSPGKTDFRNYSLAIHIMRGGTSEIKSKIMTASFFTGWRLREIEAFLNHRKRLGVKVTSTVYEETPHISHLQYEKLSYSKSVLNFVGECLNTVYDVGKRDEILTSKL